MFKQITIIGFGLIGSSVARAIIEHKQAEEALGNKFDISEFHDRILENGTIPLDTLRAHIEKWISDAK